MKSNHFWSVRWILTTLLAIAGVAVLARLGIWQLDRLAERRIFNERVLSQLHASPLDLNQAENQAADLYNMEYRSVSVSGEYDFSQEVLLRNQALDVAFALAAQPQTSKSLPGLSKAAPIGEAAGSFDSDAPGGARPAAGSD